MPDQNSFKNPTAYLNSQMISFPILSLTFQELILFFYMHTAELLPSLLQHTQFFLQFQIFTSQLSGLNVFKLIEVKRAFLHFDAIINGLKCRTPGGTCT